MPMKKSFVLAAAIAICGCAAQPQIWVNPAATQAQAQSDEARCDYEANAATATYGSGQTARSTGEAMGQGFAAGIGRSIEINKLSALCMRAKGYALQTGASTAPALPPSGAVAQIGTSTSSAWPGFAVRRLSELVPGVSSVPDAVKLLGPTTSESTVGDGTTLLQWQYFEGSKGAHVAIIFAKNGTMVRVMHKFQTGF
jgi:hypothetical protein